MSSLVRKKVNEAIDALEVEMLRQFKKKEADLNHSFFKGLYVRECVMDAGMRVTSKIHRETHPYFVMQGTAEVWIDGVGWELIVGPYYGVTLAGTRRVLRILKKCFWITVHSNPDDGEDLEVIEERIIEKHENKLLNNISQQQIEGV